MSISRIENINTYQLSSKQAFKNFHADLNSFNNTIYKKEPVEECSTKVKVGVLSTAILGTMAVLYGITKKRGQNPLKNFNIFKQEINPLDMLKITGVTVSSSLIAGIALDKKENRKAKVKEGISQMVGNLIIPITMVDQAIKLKDKLASKPLKNPILKGLSKTHKAIYTAVALVSGLMIGNKVANKINSTIFPEHKTRPLKIQDFSAHFDDVCFATSLILHGNKLGEYASRIIPATLLVSAYETGTKTKNQI